jgi:hypothetical protein
MGKIIYLNPDRFCPSSRVYDLILMELHIHPLDRSHIDLLVGSTQHRIHCNRDALRLWCQDQGLLKERRFERDFIDYVKSALRRWYDGLIA